MRGQKKDETYSCRLQTIKYILQCRMPSDTQECIQVWVFQAHIPEVQFKQSTLKGLASHCTKVLNLSLLITVVRENRGNFSNYFGLLGSKPHWHLGSNRLGAKAKFQRWPLIVYNFHCPAAASCLDFLLKTLRFSSGKTIKKACQDVWKRPSEPSNSNTLASVQGRRGLKYENLQVP